MGKLAGGLIGGGLSLVGGLMGGKSAERAAGAQADAQLLAAQRAAEESRFRPVAITTGFGKSNFEMGEDGRLKSAGYELTPEMQAIRDRLIGQAGLQGLGFTEQGLGAAQGLFGLGQSLLPTSAQYGVSAADQNYIDQLRGLSGQFLPQSVDTQANAQRFFQQQQDILRPEREQAMSGLQNRLAQTGTQGLGVAQAGGGQANPLMQAFANAQAQQDRVLAGQAEQQARQNLIQDVEMGTRLGGLGMTAGQEALDFDRRRVFGDIQTGTGMLSDAFKIATGGYSPLSTQLSQAQGVEGLGQTSLDLGAQLGGRAANAGGAQALMQGGLAAANTLGAVQGNNPMANMLMGLGQNQQFTNALGGMFGGGSGGSAGAVSPMASYAPGSANARFSSWF